MFMNIDNLRINYSVKGDGDNILVIHGWGGNIESVSAITERLSDNYRVYALDLPNFGNSGILNFFDSYSVADIIQKFLKRLNLLNISLIGYSFGGKIASIVASKMNIDNLVLIGTPGIRKISKKKNLKYRVIKVLKFILNKIFFINENGKLFQFIRKKIGSKDYSSLKLNLINSFKRIIDEDLTDEFKKIKNRTLIINGDKDNQVYLKTAFEIHSLIEKSNLLVIEDNHYCLENLVLLEAIENFFERG